MLKIPRSIVHKRLVPLHRVSSTRRCSSQSGTTSQAPKDGVPPPPPPPKQGIGFLGKFAGFTVAVSGGAFALAYYYADIDEKDSYAEKAQKTLKQLTKMKDYLPGQTQGPPERKADTSSKTEDNPDALKSMLPQKGTKSTPSPVQKAAVPEETKTSEPVKQEMTAQEKKDAERAEKAAREEKQKEEEKKRFERARQAKAEEEFAQNKALESILSDLVHECSVSAQLAMEAQKLATKITRDHIAQLKKAMDSAGEPSEWEAVTLSQDLRADASENADRLTHTARMNLEKLKVILEEGKENSVTKKNTDIKKTEECLKQLKYELGNTGAELSKAQSEVRVMKEYQDLVKKGKEQFKKEVESLTPEVHIKQGWNGSMSVDDLNSLIAHAHRRIEQLQRQLAEQQSMETQRMEAALASQKAEDDKLAAERVQREKENMKSEFEIEKIGLEVQAQLKTEDEIRQQLARQAAAHSDHLAQVLKVQHLEFESQFQVLLQDKLMQERAAFNAEIAGHIHRLRGIEAAVEARADMEKQGRQAQELWLACQTLATLIQEGSADSADATWEERLKPLKHEVKAIQEVGGRHPMVSVVLESIPSVSLERGVWTEISLMERFQKVRRVCRRVAMVNETNNTLFKFFVSYVQSFFVFSQGKPLTESDEVDPEKLTTFVLLDNAKWCLDRGDLEQAMRFMNQLTGESRKVASDWINEARLLLETKQASDALLAYASASGLGSLY